MIHISGDETSVMGHGICIFPLLHGLNRISSQWSIVLESLKKFRTDYINFDLYISYLHCSTFLLLISIILPIKFCVTVILVTLRYEPFLLCWYSSCNVNHIRVYLVN